MASRELNESQLDSTESQSRDDGAPVQHKKQAKHELNESEQDSTKSQSHDDGVPVDHIEKLAMRDLLGAIMVLISQQRREKYLREMRCLRTVSKFIRYSIFGWVAAKALPTNDARVVVKFLKSLFSQFGIPRAIISDRGTHFCNDQFTRVTIKYGVTHRLATAYHPQTSGRVEVSNHGLKRILERTVGENRASWSVKLDDALWAFRIAYKTSIGCTPYKEVLLENRSCFNRCIWIGNYPQEIEEIEDFLNDDSIPDEIDNSDFDPKGDIRLIEKLLNADPCSLPPMDLKLAEESKEKSFVEEPPELELKDFLFHLEYAFLEDSNKLPVIIAKNLKVDEREALLNVLKSHKRAIAWKIFDIKGIDSRFCTHKILMEDDYKPAVQSQRRPVGESNSLCSKKGGITVVANEDNELIPMRLVTGWRVCIDYRKLNDATRKEHFPLSFMDQMLERDTFSSCLTNLDKMLNRCEETNLVMNWEKCNFKCREGIVLGHKISMSGIEVDRAKVDVIAKLPHPTTVKGVRSFLGHAGFYRRFIQDFSKIARPMTI
nr:retrovirus-related Pol polyprotein from transposon opus [Tanacetum cinerariifolium]